METLVNPDFWRGRRVLITGHTGFKGGWLCLWLNKMGAKLYGFALPVNTTPSLFEVAHVGATIESILGDIRDLETAKSALLEAKPEIVFHLAAQPLVRLSYEDPLGTYATNVMGTVHILEAVRACPYVRAVIVVTSDKCYENREWEWGYRENEAMGGFDPYSSSKGCSELVCSAYRRSYFNPNDFDRHGVAIASARSGNVIGGGDWADDRLIPDFIRAVTTGQQLCIRSPRAIRPWQHVLEPLGGYILLAQRLIEYGARFAQAWNFGPNDQETHSVGCIVERLVQKWGDGASWCPDEQRNPHEARYLKLDISKVRTHLGWEPRWSLEEMLDYTLDWYRVFYQGEDMMSVSIKQIEAYMETH